MALLNHGKDKREDGTSDLVMAYLEDAQRVRCPFFVRDGLKVDHSAVLQALDEKSRTLNLQVSGSFAEKVGGKVDVVFIHENLRLGAPMQLMEIRGGTVVLGIPDELKLLERRKQPRARLNAKEGATLTGLSSLFEGVGINGILENLSESGCGVRVEKAMNIANQKNLHTGTSLVPVGHVFMILKLNKVPRSPAVMEMGGKVVYLEDKSGGLVLGLFFEKSEFAGAIRSMVSSRAGSIPSAVPPKARRKTIMDEPDVELGSRAEITRKPAEALVPTPPAEPSQPEIPTMSAAEVPPAVPEPPALEPVPAGAPCPNRNAALLRLKKRSRAVVVLASSAEHGELLRGHLLNQGYGRILIAFGWEDVVVHLLEPSLGLLLIDNNQSVLESFELVQRLRDVGLRFPSIVLAAEEVSRSLVLASQRIGISQLLVKPYALDESLSMLLEQQMGLS